MAREVSKARDYVLFVHERCPGSREAMDILNGSPLRNSVEVQNVATVPARMLPEYVDGVPTVVDLRAREVHKGQMCIEFMRQKIDDELPSYVSADVGYGSIDGSPCGGGPGFASVDVSQQLTAMVEGGSSTEGMDITKYQALRNQTLPKRE